METRYPHVAFKSTDFKCHMPNFALTMNIKLHYLYRDGANYKKHDWIVFSNSSGMALTQIEETIRESLVEGEWFYASKWQLPDLHFEDWDEETDHNWHEFDCIEETDDTDVKEDITVFLHRINSIEA